MRMCGLSWGTDVCVSLLPLIVKRKIDLGAIVESVFNGKTNEHWFQFFSEFILPCNECRKQNSLRVLPYVEGFVSLPTVTLPGSKSWMASIESVRKHADCQQALKLIESMGNICWKIRDNFPPGKRKTIAFNLPQPSGMRGASGSRAIVDIGASEGLNTLEAMRSFLMDDAPGFDISVYSGAIGGGSGVNFLLNYHGLAQVHTFGNVIPLYDPFQSIVFERNAPPEEGQGAKGDQIGTLPQQQSGNGGCNHVTLPQPPRTHLVDESGGLSDAKGAVASRVVAAPTLLTASSSSNSAMGDEAPTPATPQPGDPMKQLKAKFPWMNLDDLNFVRSNIPHLNRGCCQSFLTFERCDTSIGSLYTILNPKTGAKIQNCDDV